MDSQPIDTKPCRSCLEPIHASATKCPHCQAFQNRWIVIAPIILSLLFAVFAFYQIAQIRGIRGDGGDVAFVDVQQQIKIADVHMEAGELNADFVRINTKECWVYLTLKNESDYAWDDFEFVVEFFDADGERLDMVNVTTYFTVEAHSDLSTRLECTLRISPSDVTDVQVTLSSADQPFR